MKKIISVLLTIILMFGTMPAFSSNNTDINVAITVSERNGVDCHNYLVRRGIPFAKGELYSDTTLCVIDGDSAWVTSTEEISKHNDGSVHWLLVSFVINLDANEEKTLYLTNGVPKSGDLSCNSAENIISNSSLAVVLNENNSCNIEVDGNPLMNSGGMQLYAETLNGIFYLDNIETELIKNTNSYIKVKISGILTNNIYGEIYVTLPSCSDSVYVDYRITAKGNAVIKSTGMIIDKTGTALSDTVFDCKDFYVISYDNTRFYGAVNNAQTGFIVSDDKVKIAPIVNESEFTYYDGVSRTNHMYISLSSGENYSKNVANPPSVCIDTMQFVRGGIIETDKTSAPADDIIETVISVKNKLNGRFEAGSIPLNIDAASGTVSTFGIRLGETEYNLGYAYMMTGNSDIYNMIYDSAEAWADVVIYKGKYEEIYGAGRYRTGDFTMSKAFESHPYYGDPSGLYMAYVLSGDEYLKEVFIACADHLVSNMYKQANCGGYIPRMWYWSQDDTVKPSYRNYGEVRYLISARALYYAYMLLGAEKYKNAYLDVIEWGNKTQQTDGSWHQAYYNDGTPITQLGDENPAVKIYLMTYGLRGLCDVLKLENNETIKSVVLNFARYICIQNENYGQGLWHPNGDIAVYETNEDGSRGKSSVTDMLAAEILCCAYEISKEDVFLENMLSLIEHYICTSTGGLGFFRISEKGYPVLESAVEAGRCLSFLKSSGRYMKIFEHQHDLIESLGYEELLLIFDDAAITDNEYALLENYGHPDITQNVFSLNGQHVLMAANNYAYYGDFDKQFKTTVEDTYLWTDINNSINSNRNVLSKNLKHFETVVTSETPIKITGLTDNSVNANIIEYSKDAISIELTGGGVCVLEISDGKYEIDDNKLYNVVCSKTNTGYIVIVTHGGDISPNEGILKIDMDFGSYYAYNSFNTVLNINQYPWICEDAVIDNKSDFKNNVVQIGGGGCLGKNFEYESNIYVFSCNAYEAADVYLDNKLVYRAVKNDTFTNIALVFYRNTGCADIYVDGAFVENKNLGLFDVSRVIIKNSGSENIHIDDFAVGYFDTSQAACNFVSLEFTDEETNAINKLLYILEESDESGALYKKAMEAIAVIKNKFISENIKASYIELANKLYSFAISDGKSLKFLENFDAELNRELSSYNYLKLLSNTNVSMIETQNALLIDGRWSQAKLIGAVDDAGDNVVVEFSFMQPIKSVIRELYICQDTNGKDIAAYLKSNGNDIVCYNGNIDTPTTVIYDYEAGKWYNFKLYINLELKKYSVYVDGQCKIADACFASINGEYKEKDINRVFRTIAQAGANLYYIDNICIYNEYPPKQRIQIDNDEHSINIAADISYENFWGYNTPLLISAFYNDDKLCYINMQSLSENSLIKQNISVDKFDDGNYLLKVFLWDNYNNLMPVSEFCEKDCIIANSMLVNSI